jgi:hypothetical protein
MSASLSAGPAGFLFLLAITKPSFPTVADAGARALLLVWQRTTLSPTLHARPSCDCRHARSAGEPLPRFGLWWGRRPGAVSFVLTRNQQSDAFTDLSLKTGDRPHAHHFGRLCCDESVTIGGVPLLAGLSRETVVTPIILRFENRRFPARPFTLRSLPRQGQAPNGMSSSASLSASLLRVRHGTDGRALPYAGTP